jgi:hypothetical protein
MERGEPAEERGDTSLSLTPSEVVLLRADAFVVRRRPWGQAALWILVVGSMLGASFAVAVGVRRGAESTTWPLAEGVIVSSEVTSEHGADGVLYAPSIHYTWTVAGKSYAGSAVTAEGPSSSSVASEARSAVARHPAGSVAKVAYNPIDPSDGVLEPGVSLWFLLIGTVLLLATGLVGRFAVSQLLPMFLPLAKPR